MAYPLLKQMTDSQNNNFTCNGFMITGTDTEIGKTFVSGCIAKTLLKQNYKIAVRKPIASGCILNSNGQLVSEDALFLQKSSLTTDSLNTICPYQFSPAISPERAIRQANKKITINDLYQASRCDNSCNFTLIEGAGGFLSPLALDGLNADLALQHSLPIILVVGNRLGCINHALLTIEAIRSRDLKLHSVIVNDVSAEADRNNYIDLKEMLEVPVLHVPFNKATSPQIIEGFNVT